MKRIYPRETKFTIFSIEISTQLDASSSVFSQSGTMHLSATFWRNRASGLGGRMSRPGRREGGRPLTTDSAKPRKVMNHFYDSLGHSSPIRGGRLSVSRYKRAFFPPRPGWNTSRKLPPTAVISRGGSRVTPSRRYHRVAR